MPFGIGITSCKTMENVGMLWRSAYLYDADFLFMLNSRYKRLKADTPNAAKHIPLFEWDNLEIPHAFVPIIVEKCEGSTSLWDFEHPRNTIYILGAEDHGVPKVILENNWTKIHIPSCKPYSMNVAVAGSLVMAHRYSRLLK